MLRKRYLKKKLDSYDEIMRELFTDCEERSVESFDGTRIAYRTIGEGLPLVVSSGVFTTYMFFHHMKDYFSPRHKLILWDIRGHPESEVPADLESMTIENCARDLKAVLDDAGVDRAILIGFSMGVMNNLEFYRHWPDRVLGMILINGPYKQGFAFVSKSKAVQGVVVSGLDYLANHTWLVEWFRPVLVLPVNIPIAKRVELNPTLTSDVEMDLYFDYAAKMDWRAGFRMFAAMGRYDGTDVLDTVKVPTLLICGERDTWTPRWIADEMHRRVKGSEFTMIPGGSHATPAENPQMINFRVDLFLNKHFHEMVEKGGVPRKTARKPRKKSGKKPAAKKTARKASAKKGARKAKKG
jgi:pimeloyl-ACP methyl ester carboxylesterase